MTVLPDTLTSIKESKLTKLIHGDIEESERDSSGRVIIDIDPTTFEHVVRYLDYDRAWAPSDEDEKQALHNAIIEWDLMIGLAEPFVLMLPKV